MNCLVTGATGFIGRQLCRHLGERGDRFTALSRHGGILVDGTPSTALDLAGESVPGRLLAGVEVVFHVAGIAHRSAPGEAFERLNYQATIDLARQAALAGVRCFVFVSSVKAMGPASGDAVRSEGDLAPPVDPYGRWKREAECALHGEFDSSGMSVVILRPALVYGPGVAGNLRALARAVRRGLPRPPAGGERSMISVADLASLMRVAASQAPEGVSTWIACDGERYTTRGLYDLLRQASGRGLGRSWLPAWVWRLAAAAFDLSHPGRVESTFRKLFGSELYSNASVLAATSWRPAARFDPVMAAAIMASATGGEGV